MPDEVQVLRVDRELKSSEVLLLDLKCKKKIKPS